MKKVIVFCALCLCLLLTLSAQAQIVETGSCGPNLTYTLDDQGTLVIEGTGEMHWRAFYQKKNIVNVIVKNGVTNIGEGAFEFCTSLTNIAIPNSVTSIGRSAFMDCTSLTSISLPNSLSCIGASAFTNCTSLTSIVIPNSVTYIEDGVFSYCISLTSITIPNGITRIGVQTFINCKSLNSVTLPNSVTYIEDGAFSDCISLISITIPNSVTRIGYFAFSGCTNLSSITVPNNVTSIEPYIFKDCTGLISITIPNNVTSIRRFAFENCTSLNSITIPNSVTSIEKMAFSSSGLKKILIPASVQSIADDAFEGCNPTIYCYSNSYGRKWASERDFNIVLLDGKPMTEYTTVTLPETMKAALGKPVEVPANIFPMDDTRQVTWSSDHPAVALVDSRGMLTPVGPGTAKITLTVDGISASCQVTVGKPLVSAQMPADITVNLNAAISVPVTCTPADAVCDWVYKIGDSYFAQVDQEGRLIGSTVGSTTLKMIDKLTGITCTAQVHVVSSRITLPAGTAVVGDEAFMGISAKRFFLPEGVHTIGPRAFANLQFNGAEIHLPASVTAIAEDAFTGSSVVLYCPAGSYAAQWAAAHGLIVIAE